MPMDLKVYDHVTGGIAMKLEGFSMLGTLGVVLQDQHDAGRSFLVTAFHVVFEPDILARQIVIWQPVDPNPDDTDRHPNKLCAWPGHELRERVRQPNLLHQDLKDQVEDYCAIELDAGLRLDVGAVRDIGEISPAPVKIAQGLEVRMRGAQSGQSTFGVVEETNKTFVGPQGKRIVDCIGVRLSISGPQLGVPTFSQGGDSGALVVTKDGHRAVGILKGLDPATNLSIVYPMPRVLHYCGVRL